jgi:cell division protein FtsN
MSSRNEKRFELRLGKRGLLLFAFGMSGLLFASFWVGLQMGRNMETPAIQVSRVSPPAPVDRGQAPVTGPARAADGAATGVPSASAPPAAVVPVAPSGPVAAPPVPPGVPEKAPPAAKAPAPQITAPPQGAPPQAGAAVAPAGTNGSTAAGRKQAVIPSPPAAARGGDPAAPAPAKATEGAKASGTTKETYNLQVASYRERAKADETAKKLGPLGFKPRVLAVDLPAKGRWYRVVIGGFDSRESAQKAADRVAKKIKGASCIIRKS